MRKEFFEILMKLEGSYSNHPMDKGGKTIYGIASSFHPTYFKKVYDLFKENKIDEAKEEAKLFYEEIFFNKLEIEKIDDPFIQYIIFDSAVNCGRKTAIRQLQYAINYILKISNSKNEQLICDGIIGPKTRKAIDNCWNIIKDDNELKRKMFHQILASRIFYYTSRKQKVFLAGWLNRLARMIRLLESIF